MQLVLQHLAEGALTFYNATVYANIPSGDKYYGKFTAGSYFGNTILPTA